MPRKAASPEPKAGSVRDAIDALESRRRKRKPSGLFPQPKPADDLDLDSIP